MRTVNYVNKFLSFFFLVLLSKVSEGQITEQYFSDALSKEGGEIYCNLKLNNTIVIGGATFENQKHRPAVTLIDLAGNAIWNTSFNDNSIYTDPETYIQKMILGNDNYIYATCMDGSNTNREVWKINPASGAIIWKKSFNLFNPTYYVSQHLVDFDSTKFIVTYATPPGDRLAYVSKSTGDTISTYLLGSATGRYGLCVDSQKNIYYSKMDSILKLNGSNPGLVIWRKEHASAQVGYFTHAYFDAASGAVFYIGHKISGYNQNGKVLKINPLDGSLISTYDASTSDVNCQDFKVSGGFLYIAWRHIYVGGGAYAYWATKYNMSTGSAAWSVIPMITGIGVPVPQYSGYSQGPMSLDIDSAGDVYLTGYYGASNFGPANWGLLKLNGNDGSTVYEKTITNDSIHYNDLSTGMAVCVFSNTPCFVGELQTNFTSGSENEKLTFVKLDPASGAILLKRYLEDVQFPSRTLAISEDSMAHTIIMKQLGGKIKLEMYDSLNNIYWTKTMTRNYFLGGNNLSVAPNGNIFLSAYSRSKNNYPPYYAANTDSIHFFQLNNTGSITKVYSFAVGMANAYPVELYSDNLSTIGFYQKNNMLYYRKIVSNSLSSEYTASVNYPTPLFSHQNCINTTSTKLWLFGYNGTNTSFIEMNKTTMSLTSLSQLPSPLNKINHTLSIDSTLVALCGKNNLNEESIGIYNTNTKDTLWTRQFSSNNSEALKCITDDEGNFLYLASYSANNIVIRKLSVSNGQQFWSYTYNGSANINNSPIDIIFDPLRDQIIVSGYETAVSNDKSALVIIVDSTGNQVSSIKRPGEFQGDNYATCSHLTRHGSLWIGGNLNKSALGLAGFLYKIDAPVITSLVQIPDEDPLQFILFPNPFSNQVTLTSNKKLYNAKASIYNSIGEIVKQVENICGESIIINQDNLSGGIYLLRLTENNKIISTKKLLIAD